MSNAPNAFAELVDYETDALSEEEAQAFEERLFAAAAQGAAPEAAFLDQVTRSGQFLHSRGTWDFSSTKARVDELIASGLKVQVIDPEPGPDLYLPTIEDDAEVVVTVFRLDARGYDSLELRCTRPDGSELKTFRDVTCDPEDGHLYAMCEAPLARITYQQPCIVTELIGTRGGERHTVAKFEARARP